MFKNILLAIFISFIATTSFAANIVKREGFIEFSGEITQGDAIRLTLIINETNIKTIHVNSPGGVAQEGFLLGNAMKNLGTKVVVTNKSYCMSACAIMFLGAKVQQLDGLLGFHIAHIPQEFESQIGSNDAFQVGQQMGTHMTNYFFTMGYTLQLQNLITQLTNRETFLIFRDLNELNKFKFGGAVPYNNVIPITNEWVADRVAGPIRLYFLKPRG